MHPTIQRGMTRALMQLTLLTYDAEAGMAYLYLCKPEACSAVANTLAARGYDDGPFELRKDYDAERQLLGIEFEARDAAHALKRAAYVLGNA